MKKIGKKSWIFSSNSKRQCFDKNYMNDTNTLYYTHDYTSDVLI